MKTLVLYVFHQESVTLDTFIERGLIDSPDIQFIFICNNTSLDLTKWKFIYDHPNINLFIRPNIGHDFQGWNEALFLPISFRKQKIIYASEVKITEGQEYLHTLFDRFVFINSTVIGPYLPSYVKDNWVDCFLSKLSDEVKMVGISINFIYGLYDEYISEILKLYYDIDRQEYAHIQSMVYGLDREGIDILMRYGLFKEGKNFPYGDDKWELICSSEIAMSAIFRHEKRSIYSYLLNQGLVKYNYIGKEGDPWHTPNIYPVCETIFSKVTDMHFPKEISRYNSTSIQ